MYNLSPFKIREKHNNLDEINFNSEKLHLTLVM
jgi:hypothetical protein